MDDFRKALHSKKGKGKGTGMLGLEIIESENKEECEMKYWTRAGRLCTTDLATK